MHRWSRALRWRLWAHQHGWLGAPLLVVLAGVVFTYLLIDPTFADPDSFYHARLAQLMTEQGIITNFPYLQFTHMVDQFSDHHLLYHLFLVPFMKLLPMFVAAKVATVLLASIFFAAWYLIARNIGGWWALLAALMMLGTKPFDFRLGLTKASALALIMLFIAFWLLAKRRLWWVAVVGFLYAWTHGGFALLWVVAAVTGLGLAYDASRGHLKAIWSSRYQKRHLRALAKNVVHFSVIPTLVAMLSTAAGTIINPYFPQNIPFLWEQFVQIGVFNYQDKISVGAEWYPYPIHFFVPDTALMCIALVSVLVLCIWYAKRLNGLSWASLLLALFFIVMTLKSRRFVEYAVPWGLLAATLTWGSVDVRSIIEHRWKSIHTFFSRSRLRRLSGVALIGYFVVMLPAIAVRSVIDNKNEMVNAIRWDKWQGASAWLVNNAPHGETIFHDDWDGFPLLFAHDPYHNYIVGLDPTFLYLYDQDLYWKYVHVTKGEEEGALAPIIQGDFGARYIFAATDHARLQNQLRRDPAFAEVYRDYEASIFFIK